MNVKSEETINFANSMQNVLFGIFSHPGYVMRLSIKWSGKMLTKWNSNHKD